MNELKNALVPPAAFPFQSHYIEVLGHRIHWVEQGQGEPVLFIHGNPTSSYLWRNVLPGVARRSGRRTLALDLLGFGKSDKPARVRYSLRLHADVVAGFIQQMGLRNVVLVADDWGGPFSADFALRHPELMQGLVLMETFLWPMSWQDDFAPEFRTPFRLMRTPLGFLLVQVMNVMVRKLIPEHCPISDEAMRHYTEALPTIASRRAMREFPKLLAVEGDPADSTAFMEAIWSGLPRLKMPVAWIKARPGVVPSDDFPPSLKRLEETRRKLPHLEVLDFGPGYHFLSETNPQRLVELVSGWLIGHGLAAVPLGAPERLAQGAV